LHDENDVFDWFEMKKTIEKRKIKFLKKEEVLKFAEKSWG
jgi:hypothetical protein